MRKRIGVFIGEVGAEFQRTVLHSIFSRAKELDYDVFVFANFGSYSDNVLYAEGEKAIVYLPEVSAFQGLIVAEDTLDIDGMGAELEEYLRKNAVCPVVYLRSPKDDFYNIRVDDLEAMEDVTRHFVVDHGFRDICFMTGKKEYADAQNRYRGFLNVMEEAGIPVTEHMVFEGDYWREKGKEAVDWFMEGRETYPEAIICSNDYMALSVCEELEKRGVCVPEKVCVSGYDNITDAEFHQPSLTTVRIPFEKIGTQAVEMIDNVCSGRSQEHVERVKGELVLRKSCGCGRQEIPSNWSELREKIYIQDNNIKQIVFMTTDSQDAFEESDYLLVAEQYIHNIRFDKAYLCLCDEEEKKQEEKADCFTENMILKRFYSASHQMADIGQKFPRKELLPPRILTDEGPEAFLIFSIHCKHNIYGYIVLTFPEDQWPDSFTQAYLMSLANAIEDGVMHQDILGLEQIKMIYLKDSLTGIYNRRGFEKNLRQIYEGLQKDREHLSIVSIDMDGLKYINDHYGHGEGDEALRRLAKVMENIAGERDVCARMGGDEFAMLLLSEESNRNDSFEEVFITAVREEEERADKPYPFHASIGICALGENNGLSLMECMQLADKRMYEQKKKNKMTREDMINKLY